MGNVEVKVVNNRKTEQTVEVIRIVGILATVKGNWSYYEPLRNRYDVEVSSAMKTARYQKAIKEGKKVTADIRFVNNIWVVKSFNIPSENEEISQDTDEDRATWEDY